MRNPAEELVQKFKASIKGCKNEDCAGVRKRYSSYCQECSNKHNKINHDKNVSKTKDT